MLKQGSYAPVIKDDMCLRRLPSFRGFDEDGDVNTNTNDPLLPGVYTQDDEGNVGWSNQTFNNPPDRKIRVANTTQGADAGNYVKTLIGRGDDHGELDLIGSEDTTTGQWKLVWVASVQKWTTVPDDSSEQDSLCTTLMADAVLDPDNTTGFLLQVETTAFLAVGVSLKIGTYELSVTEIVDDDYVRVELITVLGSPATIEEGEQVCNIGFRPCPRTEEPYADTVVCCLDDVPVAIEMPANVNDVPVPGLWWRNQLGQVGFVAAPVNGSSGIISPNLILTTPEAPVVDGANLPSFRAAPGYTFLSTPTTVYTQASGGAPANDTEVVTLSGTTGYVSGAIAALMSVDVWGISTSSDYHCYIKVNGVVRAHILLVAAYGSQGDVNQFLAPIPSDTEMEIEVEVVVGTAGTYSGFNVSVVVEGYLK